MCSVPLRKLGLFTRSCLLTNATIPKSFKLKRSSLIDAFAPITETGGVGFGQEVLVYFRNNNDIHAAPKSSKVT